MHSSHLFFTCLFTRSLTYLPITDLTQLDFTAIMMEIQVTLNAGGDHPTYNLQLKSKDGKYRIEQALRFATCRDFHVQIMEPCTIKVEAPFPVTKKRSSLGIKLSEEHLQSRTTFLNMVIK
jgi:hypothetical protein